VKQADKLQIAKGQVLRAFGTQQLFLKDLKVSLWEMNYIFGITRLKDGFIIKTTFYRIDMKFFILNICLYDQGIQIYHLKLQIFVSNKINKTK